MCRSVVKNAFVISLLTVCLLLGFGRAAEAVQEPGEYRFMPLTPADFSEPPGLLVSLGEQEISPARGNFSWRKPLDNGLVTEILACGSHMLENMERNPQDFPRLGYYGSQEGGPRLLNLAQACPFVPDRAAGQLPGLELPAVGERIALTWELEPNSLRVQLYDFAGWAARRCGNTTYDELLLADFYSLDKQSLPLPEGDCLYVLSASWGEEMEPFGGRAEYGFYVARLK